MPTYKPSLADATKSDSCKPWHQRFNAICQSGLLAELSELELRVLWVLMFCSDNTTGETYVPVETIAKKVRPPSRIPDAVVNTSRVLAALQRLEERGIIDTPRPSKGRTPAVRRVLLVPCNQAGERPGYNQAGERRQPGRSRNGNQAGSRSPTRPQTGPQSSSVSTPSPTQQHQHPAERVGAAHAADAAVEVVVEEEVQDPQVARDADAALAGAGIDQDMRERLLREVPGLTRAVVSELNNRIRGKVENRAGVLIKKIRSEGLRLVREHAEQRERDLQRQEEAAEHAEAAAAARHAAQEAAHRQAEQLAVQKRLAAEKAAKAREEERQRQEQERRAEEEQREAKRREIQRAKDTYGREGWQSLREQYFAKWPATKVIEDRCPELVDVEILDAVAQGKLAVPVPASGGA